MLQAAPPSSPVAAMDEKQVVTGVVPASAPPKMSRRRRVILFLLLTPMLAVLGFLGWYGWRWYAAPTPPAVALEGFDPPVADLIRSTSAWVRSEPYSGEAWGELGEVLHVNTLIPEALVCYQRAEQLDPNNPRWPYFRGFLLAQGNAEAALTPLRRSAELCERYDKFNPVPRLAYAEALLQTGRYDEADQQLGRAAAADPQDARVQYDLGLLAAARDDLPGAVQHFTAAAGADPARKKASAQLALMYGRLDQPQAAAAFDARAKQVPPDPSWVDKYVEEAVKKQTGKYRLHELIGMNEKEGKEEEVARLARDLPDEDDGGAKFQYGMAELKMKRYPEAEQAFRQGLEQAPRSVALNYGLGSALFYEGDLLSKHEDSKETARAKFRAAADFLQRALDLKADHFMALEKRGICLNLLDRREEGMESLRTAVRCRPDLGETHFNLGEALADERKWDDALAELQTALELANGDLKKKVQQSLDRARAAKGAK
jgi:tetratricopeptide (TPR) repeat protein